ncbi:hypothetical protein IEI94_11905 [Halomonas sp. ML-15]|uniref:hypothetical protein n=1 Tax=Halomonas sp. ML-15 TaxID=2773305 RepID=UPI0017478E40|nr:hypothetical protein [Halomonas sp. ML-15]MBD3896554.1 hypothetical protein [Halomonas sp. ML-15]
MSRLTSPLFPLCGLTLSLVMLAGCTVNTFPDGSREQQWGVPQEDGPGDQQRPGTYRDETGEIRGQTQVPER